MIAKACIAGAVALALASCADKRQIPASVAVDAISPTAPTPWLIDHDTIPRISCIMPGAMGTGTGIVIDADRVITAKHVVDRGLCTVDGNEIESIHPLVGTQDFVELKLKKPAFELRALISCAGFKEGEEYLATGYALSGHKAVTQLVLGSRTKDNGSRTYLRGSFTPGMSGGPVSDLRGRIVGIVNAYSLNGVTLAYSIALKETPICAR
jgi:S1-C subfamily serine protease